MHGLLHDPVFLLEWLALSAVAGIALWVISCGRRPWPQHRLCLSGLLLCGGGVQLAMLHLGIISPTRLAAAAAVALLLAAALRWTAVLSSEEAFLFLAMAVALPASLLHRPGSLGFDTAAVALLLNALALYLPVTIVQARRGGPAASTQPASLGPDDAPWLARAAHTLLLVAATMGLFLVLASRLLGGPLDYLEGFAGALVAWFVADRFLPQRHRAVVILPGLAVLLYLFVTTPGMYAYLALWLAASAVALALRWLTMPRSGGLPAPATPGPASLPLRPFLAAAALCTALCGGNVGRVLSSLVQAARP